MKKPLLCLDVDGVLCPFEDPGGYRHVPTGEGDWIWVSTANRDRLRRVAESFRLVWATSWEHKANKIIAPLHEIGPLPVIEWDWHRISEEHWNPELLPKDWVGYHDWKLPWICEYARGQSFAWIDDDASDEGIAWAEQQDPAALIIRPASSIGFTDMHVERLLRFAAELGGEV